MAEFLDGWGNPALWAAAGGVIIKGGEILLKLAGVIRSSERTKLQAEARNRELDLDEEKLLSSNLFESLKQYRQDIDLLRGEMGALRLELAQEKLARRSAEERVYALREETHQLRNAMQRAGVMLPESKIPPMVPPPIVAADGLPMQPAPPSA